MSAYSGVLSFLQGHLLESAENLGYSKENILILEGDATTIKNHYPVTYKNILSCTHQADARYPFDYARDLVASWVMEDIVFSELQNCDFELKRDGADKNRRILPNQKTSSSSDYLIDYRGKAVKLELMCDYTGYWEKTGLIDLRDEKYLKMKKEASLFLGICVPKAEYFLLNFGKSVNAKYIPFHRPYHKPAYEINVRGDLLKHYTAEKVIEDIKNALKE